MAIVETLRGTGRVFDAEISVADVQYKINVHKHRVEGDTLDGRFHELSTAANFVQISPTSAISRYFSSLKILTLHMRDGRKQDFYVTGGVCTAFGGLR